MIPDRLLNSRSLLCGTIIAIGLLTLTSSGVTSPVAQGFKTPGYCVSEPTGPIVYFSAIFDTKLNQSVRFSSNLIAREFVEYLKGRYELNTPSNYPASCTIFRTMAEAEARKRDYQAQMRQANKQVVEVDWKYAVDEEL